jgi:hypothetical protein
MFIITFITVITVIIIITIIKADFIESFIYHFVNQFEIALN